MYEQGAQQPPPQPPGAWQGYTTGQPAAPAGGSGIERNILTILRALGWGALAISLLSAATLCAIGIAEAGELSRGGSPLSNFAWIKAMLYGLVIGLAGILFWAVFAALGMILENQTRGRR